MERMPHGSRRGPIRNEYGLGASLCVIAIWIIICGAVGAIENAFRYVFSVRKTVNLSSTSPGYNGPNKGEGQ